MGNKFYELLMPHTCIHSSPYAYNLSGAIVQWYWYNMRAVKHLVQVCIFHPCLNEGVD